MKSIAGALREAAGNLQRGRLVLEGTNVGIGQTPTAVIHVAKTVPAGKILKYGNTTIHTYGDIDCQHDWGECHPKCVHLSWTREPVTPYGNCSLFKKSKLGKCRCSHGSGAIRCRECHEATKRLIWQ